MENSFKKMYYKIFIISSIITIFGLLMVFSSSVIIKVGAKELSSKYALGQSLKAFIGFVGMVGMAKFLDYKKIEKMRVLFILLSVILLIVVLFIGKRINGGHRWLSIPHILSFQPSEVAKFSLIIYTASYISRNSLKLKKSLMGLVPLLFIIGVIFLLVLIEPDMSSGFLLFLIPIAMIFIGAKKVKTTSHLPILLFVFAIIMAIGISLQPYRISRIKNFYSHDPSAISHSVNYQQNQALSAIANGGIGKFNIGGSHQKIYLPEAYNDFIFAIICEEFGFIGASLLILFYAYLIIVGLKLAISLKDLFGRYLVIGIILNISLFTIIHLFVSLRIIPTTGITLPFISFGGTSLILNMLSIGLVLSVAKRGELDA